MPNVLSRLRTLAVELPSAVLLLGSVALLWCGTTKASAAPEDWFGDPITSSFGPCYSLALGDLDGDGKLDLFGCTYDNPSYDYFAYGDGAGHFNNLYSVGAPYDSVNQVALADLTGDGLADPIQISNSQYRLSVLLRQPDATYYPAEPTEGIRFGGSHSFVVGDFDHDGRPDVVVTCNDGTFFAKGGPNATFTVGAPFAAPNMSSLVEADFNGDGFADVITSGADGAVLWFGSPTGPGNPRALPGVDTSGSKVVGDFNGDGKPDFAGAGYDAGSNSYGILVYLGDGAGGFSAPIFSPGKVGDYYYFPSGPARSADIDGDGKDDFIQVGVIYNSTFTFYESGLRVFRSKGGGKLEVVYLNSDSGTNFAIGDVDGDGRPDLVTFGYGGSGYVATCRLNQHQPPPPPYVPANPAGQFRFEAAAITVDASKATASVTVTRVGGTAGAVSVSYATVDGTAHAGQDYTAASGTLAFADRQAVATITVPLRAGAHDGAVFQVQLSAPVGGAEIYAPGTLAVTMQIPAVDPYAAAITAAYAQATASFAAGDTGNGYLAYAYYRYYLYLQGGNAADLQAYYQNLAYGYYIAYTQSGNPSAALAWYQYLTGFI